MLLLPHEITAQNLNELMRIHLLCLPAYTTWDMKKSIIHTVNQNLNTNPGSFYSSCFIRSQNCAPCKAAKGFFSRLLGEKTLFTPSGTSLSPMQFYITIGCFKSRNGKPRRFGNVHLYNLCVVSLSLLMR